MTDITRQNKTKDTMNIPRKLPGTTDTKHDSGAQSKALPQADALKARFKAGSIPLQTDFADVIDLANMCRQAVGGTEGQTGPANGFTLSSMGRLELKLNTEKGICVDQNGVAVKVDESKGVNVSGSGIGIKLYPNYGLAHDSWGIWIRVNKSKGVSVDKDGLQVISGNGIQIDSSGVGVKAGNGITANSSGVGLKLAKGSHTNGGGGQGADGLTVGNAGGLALSSDGLSVDAGDGIEINTRGVSLKLAANSGLSASETDGLKIKPGAGFEVNSSGVNLRLGWGLQVSKYNTLEVKPHNNGGLKITEDGLTIKPGNGISVDSNVVNVKPHSNSSGLAVNSGGLWVKPHPSKGIVVDNDGVGIKLAQNSGLNIDGASGLKIASEQTFQKGMVIMFSGTSIPLGWALCDGNNGTPDLMNRFIMGGAGKDVGGRSAEIFSGGRNAMAFSFSTKKSSVKISGSTMGHSLTAAENGPHSHAAGIAVQHTTKCLYRYNTVNYDVDWLNAGSASKNPMKYEPVTQADGSGKAHSHNISFTSGDHEHAGNLTVPYYILAFIMKL